MMNPAISSLRVHAVYVIVEDGRCAYNRAFSEAAPAPHLVSAMLTAMQVFIREVTGNYFTNVDAGPFSFIAEKAGPFSVVIISGKSEETFEKAKYLTIRFMKRYKGTIENWKGETIEFADFDKDVDLIFGRYDEPRKDPTRPLDVFTLMNLDHKYQVLAKALIGIKEAKVERIAEKAGEGVAEAQIKLDDMVEKGYVGRFSLNNEKVYFVF